MRLSKQQETVIEALDWLLDDLYVGQGRTVALCVALIRVALRTPGRWIYYMDHFQPGNRAVVYHTRETIGAIIRGDALLDSLNWTFAESRFMVDRIAPIPNWWPEPDVPDPGVTVWDHLNRGI